MSVFKINKTKDYTIMSNFHLREKEMTLKAKGLLSLMLSLPEDWDYSIKGLVAICKEEECSIVSTLKELKKFGYLKVVKLMPNQTKSGRIEYEYNIYEIPEKQGGDFQGLEIQAVENQGQLNKEDKKLNNKLENNIKDNKDAMIVIGYLNKEAEKKFTLTKSNLKFIKARLKEYSIDDLKSVIDKKVVEWKNTEFERYLRPETLFNATKFESYLNQSIEWSRSKPQNTGKRNYTKDELDSLIQSIDSVEI